MRNALTDLLGIDFPLLQAGMGGVAGPTLAAAVAEAGAGGVLALYRSSPRVIGAWMGETRALTQRPFGVNLIPELLSPEALLAQVQAVLAASDRRVFLNFFGMPSPAVARALRQAGRAWLVMVGSIQELREAQHLGADAVILQGTEAGGHLLGHLPLDELVDAAVHECSGLPLVAAGGIGDGAHFHDLQRRGMDGCLCGTLFVATAESRAHPLYKERLLDADADDTLITDLFDGGWPSRRHRVLGNRLTVPGAARLPRTFIAHADLAGRRHPLARYSACVPDVDTEGHVDEMALYAGRSVSKVVDVVTAQQRVSAFVRAFQAAQELAAAAPHQELSS